MKAFTDYPILRLGDKYAEPGPIREVTVLGYDRDRYCLVEVKGVLMEIKRGYLCKTPELVSVLGSYTHEECEALPDYDCTNEESWQSLRTSTTQRIVRAVWVC